MEYKASSNSLGDGKQATRTDYGTSCVLVCDKHPPEIGCQSFTCDLQLIHGDTSFPSIQAVVHAQRLDDVHSCLAHSGGCLRHNKSLHCAVLPFHHMHPDCHTVGALLTPTPHAPYMLASDTFSGCMGTMQLRQGNTTWQWSLCETCYRMQAAHCLCSDRMALQDYSRGKVVVKRDLVLTQNIMMSLCFCIPDMNQQSTVACKFAE